MKKCLACGELVCQEMQSCQPCMAASPIFSMLHAFSQKKLKSGCGYIHDREKLLKLKWEHPFYSEHCLGR